jgi:type VI secretion system secreted protein Hcp
MAMVYFLKIDGIPGDSNDLTHKGEIDVMTVSWGMSQSGTVSAGAGGGAGKATFQDFRFEMRQNSASPALFLACAQGTRIKEALLTVRKSGADQPDFFQIKISDLIVKTFDETGDVEITQQVTLDYNKIEYAYSRENDDGSLTEVPAVGWDLAANKKL